MAAAIKAINARIRANPVTDYFCSTHFWGPASNFGIPIAAVLDTQKPPDIISGRMTAALTCYSAVFMRYALAVSPKNYLLFGCHVVNFSAQTTQAYRFLDYWNFGGKEKLDKVKAEAEKAEQEAAGLVNQAQAGLASAGDKAKQVVGNVVGK